jgi:hypothetical protein
LAVGVPSSTPIDQITNIVIVASGWFVCHSSLTNVSMSLDIVSLSAVHRMEQTSS